MISQYIKKLLKGLLGSLTFKHRPHKMVKHTLTQTNPRSSTDELFTCVWPICWVGGQRAKKTFQKIAWKHEQQEVQLQWTPGIEKPE